MMSQNGLEKPCVAGGTRNGDRSTRIKVGSSDEGVVSSTDRRMSLAVALSRVHRPLYHSPGASAPAIAPGKVHRPLYHNQPN